MMGVTFYIPNVIPNKFQIIVMSNHLKDKRKLFDTEITVSLPIYQDQFETAFEITKKNPHTSPHKDFYIGM